MSAFAGHVGPPGGSEADRILATLRDAYFALDRQWRFTYVNPVAEGFFGQPREALLGRGLLDLFPQLTGSLGHVRIERALRDGERARFETLSVITGFPIELDIHPTPEGVSVFLRDVRERWRLEEQLRERDEHLRLAEESAGIGIWDIDVASDAVRGTVQFFRIMGLEPTPDPVPMDILRGLRFPEDRERVNEGYRDAIASRHDVYDSEYRIRRPDGVVRWIFGRGRVIRAPSGEPVRYTGVDIDVTERKAAEIAFADSRDRLQIAVQAAELGIWDWNVITNEMSWNDRAKAIAGLPTDAPVSFAQIRGVTHPEDLPRTSQMARRALDPAVRSREPYEYRIVRPDGGIRWVLAHGEARFGRVGGVERAVRYIGTLQDITERKQAADRLRQSEARLRLAVVAGRLAVWGYQIGARHLESTPELNAILGYPPDHVLDVEEVRLRYLPGEQERVQAAGQQALARGEPHFQAEFRFRRADDDVRWLLLRAEILFDREAKPASVLGVLMDITEQKAAEQDRELILAELQHRMKNSLSLVAAMASQTFRGEADAQPLKAFLARLAALGHAHDLLSSENWQSADCAEVVEKSLAPHRGRENRIRIAGPSLRLAAREALSLALALNELATNAAKYGALSNSAGTVDVTWSLDGPAGETAFVLRWVETGGPSVSPPSRASFGTRLIQHNLAAEFGGTVSLDYLPGGLVCTLRAPRPGASPRAAAAA